MQVELVGRAHWRAALRDWDRLHASDPTATPFTSAGWARAWMSQWAPQVQPWVLRVTDARRVVGVAPFVLRRQGGVRVLSMLGKEPGDYWDVVADPHRRELVVAAIAKELLRRRESWDLSLVSCLPADSPTPAALAAAGLVVHARRPVACPAVALPPSFEEYLSQLPSRRRTNLRRHLRRLDEHDVDLREVRDPAELPAVVDRWRELRRLQWEHQARMISGEHLSARFKNFMLAVLIELVPAGRALVWEFRHGGEIVAVFVNFVDERTFYWYLGGIHPAALSLGIGKIAVGEGIRSSIAADRCTYDFTRGDEDYKYWYGANNRYAAALVFGHSGARSRLAMTAARSLSARRDRP